MELGEGQSDFGEGYKDGKDLITSARLTDSVYRWHE